MVCDIYVGECVTAVLFESVPSFKDLAAFCEIEKSAAQTLKREKMDENEASDCAQRGSS